MLRFDSFGTNNYYNKQNMITYLLILIAVALGGAKLRTSYSTDFFSVDQTNVIKGIAIFFVFFNHLINGYLLHAVDSLTLPLDGLFVFVDEQLTQLMVGLFLFMSGYGVSESLKRKGWKYIQSIPKKRIANTIINFDIAVLTYLVVAILIGARYDIKQIALSFFAWESIGNSNWYIFAILYCYIITYISFNILKNRAFMISPPDSCRSAHGAAGPPDLSAFCSGKRQR